MVTSREPSSCNLISMIVRSFGKIFAMELPHSTTVMVFLSLMDSARSSAMRPGFSRR